MSWRDAPIYIRAHDLARDLLPRVEDGPCPALRHRLAAEAQDLLCEVSLALSFVDGRRAHQEAADHAITRLKVLVRLARDVGVLDERGGRSVGEELVAMGRMIGGWQRRHAGPPDPPAPRRGAAAGRPGPTGSEVLERGEASQPASGV